MKRLNKPASELALEAGVRGGTDITGFSLLGHAWEMAEASGVGLRLDFAHSLRQRRPPPGRGVDLPRRRIR